MDWTVVVSTAITGAVGIAGVAGTVVSARSASKSATKDLMLQINAENNRANLAEKRRVYAACMAALSETYGITLGYATDAEVGSESYKAVFQRSYRSLVAIVPEVNLIAPTEVRELLSKCVGWFTSRPLRGEKKEGTDFNAIRRPLYDSMRADLDRNELGT